MKPLGRTARRLISAGAFVAFVSVSAAAVPAPTIRAFRANPEPVVAGMSTSYAWTLPTADGTVACALDPGDGTPAITIPDCAADVTPRHTYTAPGTYTATLELGGGGPSTTAAARTTVTVVAHRATDPKPGTLMWTYQTTLSDHSFLYSSAAIAPDGTIYFGSGDRHIYAVHPDGTLAWKIPTRPEPAGATGFRTYTGMAWATPTIAPDGTIYVPVMYDGLYALNPDGTLKWHAPIDDLLDHAAALSPHGTLYATPLHHVDAYHPDGQLAWSYHGTGTTFTLETSPAIAPDGTLYIGSEDHYLHALNPDGTQKWRYFVGHIMSTAAIGPHGTIYIGSWDRVLYAIHPNGTLKWEVHTGGHIDDAPSLAPDGTVYLTSDTGTLYAIHPDGTVKWQRTIAPTTDKAHFHGWFLSTPTIGNNGRIYIGSDNGRLYAFNPNGTTAWTLQTASALESAPAITPDGTLYITSSKAALYAIHVAATGLAASSWPKLQGNNRTTGRVR